MTVIVERCRQYCEFGQSPIFFTGRGRSAVFFQKLSQTMELLFGHAVKKLSLSTSLLISNMHVHLTSET